MKSPASLVREKRQGEAGFRYGRLVGLLAVLAVLALIWDRFPPAVAPLRLITVFFHELSHGLAAIATGGSIESIQLSPDGSGLCTTRGGSRFLVLSAGYLGSLLWGGVVLVLAARTDRDRLWVALVGLLLLAVSVLWIEEKTGFGFLACTGTGAALLVAARWIPPAANDWILRIIGLGGCLYVILDLKAIVDGRMGEGSDAHALAALTGLPIGLWGALWLLLALAAAVGFLLVAAAGRDEGRRR